MLQTFQYKWAMGTSPEIAVSLSIGLRMPFLLLPETWNRYQLTQDDVHTILHAIDNAYMQQWLLCNNIHEVQPKNKKYPDLGHLGIGPSKLCAKRPDHHPLLPLVHVSEDVIRALKPRVRELSIIQETEFEATWKWSNVEYVPIEWDEKNRLLLMTRVIPSDTETTKAKSAIMMRFNVKIGEKSYVATDEACFIQKNPKRKKDAKV